MDSSSAVDSLTTLGVISCNTEVSAPCPAAQATTIPVFAFLNSANPFLHLSVGAPSVIIKTNGFQSPFCPVVVFLTSIAILLLTSSNPLPRAVMPRVLNVGV